MLARDPPRGDLPRPEQARPAVTFTTSDIAFVYGSKWKQRYFTRVGDDDFPLGALWDVTHKRWARYFVAANSDWWVSRDPADNAKRPTGPLCDGCHSIGDNVQTTQVAEWNVGCEKCHGSGREHAARPARANICNPARVDPVHADDTGIQRHSQEQPLTNPIAGRYDDWPVGFRVGLNLSHTFKFIPPPATERFEIPNVCTSCQTDTSNA